MRPRLALAIEDRGAEKKKGIDLVRIARRVVGREDGAEGVGDERHPPGSPLGDERPPQRAEVVLQRVVDGGQGRTSEAEGVDEDQTMAAGKRVESALPVVRGGGEPGEENDGIAFSADLGVEPVSQISTLGPQMAGADGGDGLERARRPHQREGGNADLFSQPEGLAVHRGFLHLATSVRPAPGAQPRRLR